MRLSRYTALWSWLLWLLSMALLLASAYFGLVPRTAQYSIGDDGHPYHVTALYSWGSGRDRVLNAGSTYEDRTVLVTTVRAGCGTLFTSGPGKKLHRTVPEACSSVETPCRIAALVLLVLGATAFVSAMRVPVPRVEDL